LTGRIRLRAGLASRSTGRLKRDAVSGKFGTPTGTKARAGSAGIGTGFNTDGVTTTDRVLTGVAGPGGSQRTLFALFNPKSLGGGSLGRLFCASNLADELYLYFVTNAAAGYFRHTSGTRSLQFGLSSDVVFGKTMSLSISYDGSSLSNMPIGYVNGALATSSSGDAPISGGVLNPDNICIGNRPTDNTRVFDGTIFLALRWNRILSSDEHSSIAQNPWQIFEPYTVFDNIPFPIVTAQFARPTSDASTGTWTASSGTLASCLDETTASDADYITTTNTSTCEVALGSVTDPSVSTGHIVRYRISATSGGITVRLRQGTTTIATWTHATAPTSLTTYSQTLTGGEADSITDYTALRLQFEAT
jgi:hypothetical protein